MNRKLYLLSVGLLILVALLSMLQGTRFIRSPIGVFQLATLLNMVMPVVLGGLVAFFLAARFADVWRGHADVQDRAARPIARASQTAGKLLIGVFYVLLVIGIGFLILAKGQLSGEIGFLYGPLLRMLPIGLILFELGRVLDQATEP